MSLAGEDSTTPLRIGGADYAFKKLERWRAEGPTERNRRMARSLADYGRWSHRLPKHVSLLLDLALEWSDFPMWQKTLEKSTQNECAHLGLDVLVQAWSTFTFDRVKHTSVHSTPSFIPSGIHYALQDREGYTEQIQHKGCRRVHRRPTGSRSYARSKREGMVETTDHCSGLNNQVAAKRRRRENVCRYREIRRVALLFKNVRADAERTA